MASLKYGTIKWERRGNQVQETWQQGTVYEELKAKELALQENEKLILGLKNELKSRRRKVVMNDMLIVC